MKSPDQLTEDEKYQLAKAEHEAHMNERGGLKGCWDCLPVSAQMRVYERAMAKYKKQYSEQAL